MMGPPFACTACPAAFTTSIHLHQHGKSHESPQHFYCFFCNSSFSRSDTARRHAKTCSSRNGRPMPQYRKRGKGRTSCDQCAHTKLACDMRKPCRACANNDLLCTYRRLSSGLQGTCPSQPEHDNIEPSQAPSQACSSSTDASSGSYLKTKIPFLLNFYDVDRTAAKAHDALESARPVSGNGPISLDRFMALSPEDMLSVLFDHESVDSQFLQFHGVDLPLMHPPSNHSAETTPHSLSAFLRNCTRDIIKELSLAAEQLDSSSPNTKACLDSAVFHQLFSASNILGFVQLYFSTYHRHCPILHLPSFSMEAVSLPLVLAVVLCGSVCSYPRDTCGLAVDCLDLAEEYIFNLPILKAGCNGMASLQQLPALAEPLQAAVILLCLQYSRNDAEVRRRIRSQRFPMLIYAARSLSLFNLPRPVQPSEQLPFSQRESLTRTATYIFLLDCQYVTTFRSPPLMTIAEMAGNLPTSETRFYEDSSVRSPVSSLVEVLDHLMDDTCCGVENVMFQGNSIFGLFTVICALHSMIFSALASRTMPCQKPSIERALARWKLLWGRLLQQTVAEELALVGFMMCAGELFWLANAMLHSNNQEFLNGLDSDSRSQFYSLLKHVAEA